MSLLRRADRTRHPAHWPCYAQFPLTPAPSDDDGDSWRLRWTNHGPARLLSLAMTRDGQLLFVGDRAGHLLCCDSTGRPLWHAQVEGAIHRISLAEEGRALLVGMAEGGQAAHLFHFDGRLLHSFQAESEAWGIDLLPDARLIAVGGMNQKLTLWDRSGTRVMSTEVSGAIRHARFMPEDRLLVATDDHRVLALDHQGNHLWQFPTQGRLWAGVCAASQADLIIAGSNDHSVYALDRQGNGRWSHALDDLVNAVAVTPDGERCAAVSAGGMALLLDAQGQTVWEERFDLPIYSLALSGDGRFMAIGVGDNGLVVIDHADQHRQWGHSSTGRIYALAMTPDGRTLAAANTDCTMSVYDNPVLSPRWEQSAEREQTQRLVSRITIKNLRQAYAEDNHTGLVHWFAEFERSLHGQQYSVCKALVEELGDPRSYPLNDGERQVIRSLEGACWLLEGIDHHRQGRFEVARECYEHSRTIQTSINNSDGVGQVIAALSSLPAPVTELVAAVEAAPLAIHDAAEQRLDPGDESQGSSPGGETAAETSTGPDSERLLEDIARRPRVLGTAEKLLEQRMISAPPREQLRIIVLARRSGYMLPLLRGLESSERPVRSSASAALTFLQPGPGPQVIAAMLQSPESFVRWQAFRLAAERAERVPEEFEQEKRQWWPLIVNPETFGTLDALARRQAVRLVELAGSGDDTVWLMARLDDPDPDVRLAAVNALGKVGRREALARLKELPDAAVFLGRGLLKPVEDAVSAIEDRHPLPSIRRIYLCSTDPLNSPVVAESTVFLSGSDAVFAIVDVNHAPLGTQIVARWLQGDKLLHQDHMSVVAELPNVASVQELPPTAPLAGFPSRRGILPPRLGTRPGAPDGNDPDGRPGSSPFNAPRPDARSRPLPFGGRDAGGDRPGSRPNESPFGASRPRGFSFGASRPSTTPPEGPRPRGLRPGTPSEELPEERPAGRFSPPRTTTPAAARPQGERTSLFQRAPDGPQRPQRPGLFSPPGRGLRSIFDDDERPPRGFRPFGRRPAHTAARDLLENSEPGRQSDDEDDGPRPRFAPFSRQRGANSDPPDWLFTEDDEDNAFGGRPGRNPFNRPSESDGRASLFSRLRDRLQGDFESSSDDPPDEPIQPSTVSRLAFALPRPSQGWPQTPCQIEVVLESEPQAAAANATFRFVERPRIARLETGVQPDERSAAFMSARRFLTGTGQIACRVHLADAPVNTRVVGRCYGMLGQEVDALQGETCGQTRDEMDASVILQWDGSSWLAGNYRIEVEVEGGPPLADRPPQSDRSQIIIALIERVEPARISLCHQIDDQNGPVGVGWPFVPGTTPWCVVEFDDPPAEMSLEAAWYNRDGLIYRANAVIPAAEKGKRAAFELVLPEGESVVPGFYSVVIEGAHVAREERIFEVHGLTWHQRIAPRAGAIWATAKEQAHHVALLHFLSVLGGVLLFALALASADALLDHILSAPQRRDDALLWLGDLVGGTGAVWAMAWIAAGSAYSVLCTRIQRETAGIGEQRVFDVLNPLLVFAGGGLLWYQLSTVIFAPAYLRPEVLYGAAGALRWIAPILAWGAVPVGLLMANWYRQDKNTQSFAITGVSVVIMMVALAVAGYGGAIIGLFVGAIVGVIPGGLLQLIGVENQIVRALMAAGASVGFVVAPLAYARTLPQHVWREWRAAKTRHFEQSETNSFLDYCLNRIRLDYKRWLHNVLLPCLAILALALIVAIALFAMFDPVVVPVLKVLYGPLRGGAFEHALKSQKLMPLAALALWLVWPVMVWATRRAALGLTLMPINSRRLRWGTGVALAVWLGLPGMIATVSRTELVRDLSPAPMIFWTNRIALTLVAVACAGWLAFAIKRALPDGLGWDVRLPDSALGWTVVILGVLSALLWPFWMWAVAAGVILAVVVIGTPILRRVN